MSIEEKVENKEADNVDQQFQIIVVFKNVKE